MSKVPHLLKGSALSDGEQQRLAEYASAHPKSALHRKGQHHDAAVLLLVHGGGTDSLETSTAAVRFGVALALGVTAWRPRQIPGVLLIVGTMFTFTAGFAVRDWVLSTGEFVPSIVLIPLVTLFGLVWTWVADRGIEIRRAWHLLDANPS